MSDEHRQTPSERQHELLMTLATKTPRTGSETVELGQATVGDMKGHYHLKSAVFVRRDEEDWPQFLGRIEQSTADLDAALVRTNADTLTRQLQATLER